MAWRIDESVVRGELDNRTRDRVTGRIWLAGRPDPLELELTGNAWRDLAGRRLEFINPKPVAADFHGLTTLQKGVIGDFTASRKVKVPDVPKEDRLELYKLKQPFPWHWSNSVYFEWYSAANGRVVIESVNYELTIDPEIAWDMSAAEGEAQGHANANAMRAFMDELAGLDEPEKSFTTPAADGDERWATPKPLTEAEAEKLQEESDRLVDRIQARLAGAGDQDDIRKILDEELERDARERGEPPLSPEEQARRAEWIAETDGAAADALENSDPELEGGIRFKHPLAEQVLELTLRILNEPEEHGWVTSDAREDHPLVNLASAATRACAKLTGALNGYSWPQSVDSCAGTIVRLKRARRHLHEALRATEACAQQKLADPTWMAGVQQELNALARECGALIEELRAKLERGFD